jgi:AraC-like DNA-binding protein
MKAVLFLLLSTILVSIIGEMDGKNVSAFFVILNCFANMLFVPGCFLYQRNLIYNRNLGSKDFVHLIPLIIFCVGCMFIYFFIGQPDFLRYRTHELMDNGTHLTLLYFQIYFVGINTFYLYLMAMMLKNNFSGYVLKRNFLLKENGVDKNNEHYTLSFGERKSTEADITLRNFFEEKKPYLEHGYSLKQLSTDINIPLPQLSAFINQYYHIHFNDLINVYRVNYCKEKIKHGEWKYKKLEAIAGESGFSNRNTFTSAFKKITGMNPSKYLKTIKERGLLKENKLFN